MLFHWTKVFLAKLQVLVLSSINGVRLVYVSFGSNTGSIRGDSY